MKNGRRLLAMLLVLTMLLSNLPLGAIAAEVEDLTAQPTEALSETEQPTTEAPAEETEAPETTAAPTETEAVETTEAAAMETTEAATEEAIVVETEEASEEALNETVAEEENPSYLTFASVYENEDGLYVDTGYYGTEFVNPYGSITRVAFFLNEYVDGEWAMTNVQVEAVDDSISLEPIGDAIDGADYGYTVTTNTAGVTSGVSCGDVTMNIGTWPFHFHFSSDGSTDNANESLIYDLDLDGLSENETYNVYAVMFHGDYTWSDVRLSADSQRFASLYQVSDSVYRIEISGVARKHVNEYGYVNLEVLSTQTDKNTGDINEYGYMYLPIFMAPQTSLVMVGLGNAGDGAGWYENPDYISYQMMFCPGKSWECVFYLRQWDYAAGEMKISEPVDPALLQTNGDLTFTVIDPADVREGEANGAYFVSMTTNTFDQDLEVYMELEDGTRAGGVYIYTYRYFVEFYHSDVMSNDTVMTEFYIDPDGENVLYVGFSDEGCGGTHRNPPIMDPYYGTIEATDNYGVYRVTPSEELIRLALRGYPQYLQVEFEVDFDDGRYERHGTGMELKVRDGDYASYLTYGWLEGSEEGLLEGEYHGNEGFSIVPGDAYPLIFYVHTWDAEQGCYVESPVPADELYCDNSNFTIAAMPEQDYRPGEANTDCFVWVTASEWGHESEIYTYVDGVRTSGMYINTYLPYLGFYSSETPGYDSYLREYTVDAEGENVFYLAITGDYWVIEGDPWIQEGQETLLTAEKCSDTAVKVTLTQEGLDYVLSGNDLWPGILFNQRNTVDGQTQEVNAGGLRVYANSEDITPDDVGLYACWVNNDGDGWYASSDSFYGTNIAKYDEYTMYFFLKLWDAEQGCYVEIPVHPEHDEGIILNRVEDVKDGEENGEYFYHVSIADDALDMDQEVWVEYEGTRYAMPITSHLHGVAIYTTQEPSHDTRLMEPLEVDPFGENVAYLVTDGYWEIEDVRVHDWATAYVDVEVLSDTAYSVTLTQEGINQNMMQYILDVGMDVDTRSLEDSNWTESRYMNVAFSRENLENKAFLEIDGDNWIVIEGGYIHEYDTGVDDSDEEGNTWDVWAAEVLTDLPDGLAYDFDTNTLTMDGYAGEKMCFTYEWFDGEYSGRNLPNDTLTIALSGDNSLVAENGNAFVASGNLNVVITGDGSLLLKTVNDFAQDEEGNARTFNTVHMNGGYLSIEGNASVTVEIAGQGNESCWDENGKIGERAGNMTALAMDHGQLYIKDNARLETVIPEGAHRNGSEDVGEENAIWGERFPGGYRGIADTFLLKVMGGTLVTQGIEFGSGYHDDGTYWTNNYAQTGGEVIIQANGWNNIIYDEYEENGNEYNVAYVHTHYEGLTVRQGGTAGIWSGSLTVNVEAQQGSTYYEGIAVRGGELEIGGDAEVTVTANHESGNLVGVYCEDGTGKLNITGGTLNVNGTSGEGNGRLGIYLDHETVFTMSGGTINSEYADFMNHGPAHITDGTINIGGMYRYNEPDEAGFYPAWITGFSAGGPEFIIDGGEINITGGMFNADGMVAMNGGTMNINGGGLNVGTAFGFNGGEINIFNDGSNAEANVLIEEGHGWPSLRVDTYLSIAGGEGGGAPVLTIHNTMDLPTVVINGTYHQMAGSTVDITHTSTERPAIWVCTQFDEDGNPIVATDEEGNVIRDEEGNEILLTGSLLMNDGVLNVMNPGDYEADLIRAMEADPYSFTQFLGGETNFDTAKLFWNGEAHIGGDAVVEVKDAVIISNAGHLVMDGGTLRANEESALWLGMSEMNGGKMELENAMIEVNGGFHFNNGEIVIDNTAENIDSEAIFTSLAVNTYFAIGDPEDPESNPKLTINHDLERCAAVQLNGTMHLMAGSVEINVPVTRAPAISISAPIFDENGDPVKSDEQGNAIGGELLQNGGVLNINAAEEDSIAGIIAQEGSVFFMNGGEANFNGTNLVMCGKMFLYDQAVLNVNDGILRLYETASLEVDAGQLNLNSKVKYGDDVFAVLQAEAGSAILLQNNGVLTIDNEAYRTALELYGELTVDSDAQLNICTKGPAQEYDENGDWIWRFGVYANETSKITVNGGAVNVEATDINGAFVTWGEFTQTGGIVNLSNIDKSGTYEGENAIETNGPTVISGGTMNLVSTDTGYANNSVEELEKGSRVTISGGTINIEVPRLAMFLCSSTDISGGDINIGLSNCYYDMTDENGDFIGYERYAQGIFAYGWDNPDMTLNITGGKISIVVEDADRECANTYVNAVLVGTATANITGGAVRANGGIVNFYSFNEDDYLNLGDMVVYSLDSGRHLRQLSGSEEYSFGTQYFSSFSEDDDLNGVLADNLVIVTSKAGANTTWEVNDGVLTFQGEGAMADYAAKIPAPWHMVRDFITAAEMDSNLTYIGSHAFSTLSGLTTMTFLGDAPAFAEDAFAGLTAEAYFPDGDGWTEDKLQNYGGDITWIPNYDTVAVDQILTDKDVLFAGEKTTLTAVLDPEPEEKVNVIWTLAEGGDAYVTLSVKNNVATVSAKQVTEKHTVTLYANVEDGLASPASAELTVYPKAQSVSIFRDDEEVTGQKIKADVDEKLVLTASLNPADAEDYLEAPVIWTSSSASVAEVSENGVVTFLKTGTVKITATAGDGSKKKAVVTVTVLDMIEKIALDEDVLTEIVGGKSATFAAYNAETGAKLKSSQVKWTMDEEFAPYASITAAGKLSTKVVQEPVRITIVATSLDDPTVYEPHDIIICPAATLIRIEQDGLDVTGDTIPVSIEDYTQENPVVVELTAAAYPDGALTNVTWKTSSKSIATVEDGTVKGTGKAGTVTITATDSNSKKSASVKLSFGIFAERVIITSTEKEIVSGEKLTLTAETYPANPSKAGVTWSLKDPDQKAYLTVTAAGKVTAKTVYAPTPVTLVATSKDGYAEATYTLTVLPKDENILVIKSGEQYVTKTTQTLDLNAQGGATITLSAHNLATGAQETVTWTPATSKVGTLTVNADGTLTVTMTKAGSVTVTAKNADGDKATVTLKAAQLATGVTIEEKTTGASENLTLAAGKTMNLIATVAGVKKASVAWSVEPAELATISASGKLTASKNIAERQTVTVTALAKDGSGQKDSVTVTLNPLVQGIRILSESGITHPSAELTNCTVVHDMNDEQTIQLKSETYPADAAAGVTWKSSNKKVAAIDEKTGEITCVKPGTVTITATATDGSGKKATFKLTVAKKVTSLVLNYTDAVLAGGKSLTLKADAGDATDKSVTWSMTGDTTYVTLSAKGVLKASAVTAPKTVYVTATANDGSGVKAYCTVNIYPATTAVQIWHEGELTTAKTILEVPAGRTITLEGVSVPGNAADVYTWKSSGAAATVEDGVVTGVTVGKTVTITCTAGDGTGKKATVKVKVVEAPAAASEISLWTYPIGQWGDAATVEKMVSAFQAETGITVNVEYLDYAYGDVKVDTAIEADTAPDLILEGPERLVANWGASGKLVNIADLFDSTDKSQIYTNVRNACFVDETTAYQYPLAMTAHCMAINKTVFEKAGAMQYLDEQTHTWNSTEDFFAAVDAVYEYTGTTVGTVYCGGQGGDQGTRALVNNLYSGTYTNADHTAYTWDSDENIQALKALYDCEGITHDAGIVGGDEIALFYNGTLNMAFCWNITQQKNPNMANTGAEQTASGDEIMFLAFPSDGEPQLQGGIWGFGIFDNGDQARIEAAKTFIKYFCDSEATAEAVSATGYFPVRSNVTEGWTNDSVLAEYNCLMPLVGDYYQVAAGWAEARICWWTMLQQVGASDGTVEEITRIVKKNLPGNSAPEGANEISLWVYPIGAWTNQQTVDAMMADFEAETGIQVNVEYLDYADGDVKVDTAIEADTAPDLILEGPERLTANWGAKGKLVDLAGLLDSTDRAQIAANALTAFSQGDKVYGYPMTMTVHSMAINKTVFEKADAMQYLDEQTHTWNSTEDFFAAVEAVYEYTGTTVGTVYCGGRGGDQGTRALVNNLYSGTYTNADHTAYTWNTDENIQALKALYDCEGIAYNAAVAGGDEIDMFYNGILQMAFCWNITQQKNPNMANTGEGLTASGDEILFMAFPSDGEPQLQGGV